MLAAAAYKPGYFVLNIGPYRLANRVILAPMAGVTDLPFRRLCKSLGAGMVVSEMMTSDPSLWATRKSVLRKVHADEAEPRVVQIAGGDAEMLAQAAVMNVAAGAQIIDINMGCPKKKVCKKAAGSALLRDEKLVAEILAAVVAAVEVPVTLKIRTGWDKANKNGLSVAKIAQEQGITAIAVHGRTRQCGYQGEAEYHTIAEIKQNLSIPVIANGDITSPEKAQAVLNYTGADAVMVGRGAQGRPWILGQIAQYLATGEILPAPSTEQVGALLLEHIQQLHLFYGDYTGVRVARKHVGWYLADQGGKNFKRQFNQLTEARVQIEQLQKYFATADPVKDNNNEEVTL